MPDLQPDGQIVHRTATELLNEPMLLLADPDDWHFIAESLEVYRAIERDLGHAPQVLLEREDWRQTKLVIRMLFKRRGIISCSAPGLVLEVLQDSSGTFATHPKGLFRVRRSERRLFLAVDFTYNLHEPASQHRLLGTHGAGLSDPDDIFWNAGHALLAPLLEDNQTHDEKCKELLKDFSRSFYRIMATLRADPDFDIVDDSSGRRFRLPDKMNVRLVGVFGRVPWLLGELQQAAQKHWQRMQEAGAVDADAPCPELTERESPWFWSRERWEE
jgi:hypothetical protein